MPITDLGRAIEIPLTNFSTSHHRNRVLFNPADLISELVVDNERPVRFIRPGIPVRILEVPDNRFAVFFREIFSGDLYLVDLHLGTGTQHWQPIKPTGDVYFVFRNAEVLDEQIVAVLYDNKEEANYLKTYRIGNVNGFADTGIQLKLPTLEDPAGSHYEMIPALYLLTRDNRMYMLGGTLTAFYENGKIDGIKRVANCQRILEAFSTRGSLVVLCIAKVPADAGHQFMAYDLLANRSLTSKQEVGIPWRLHAKDDQPAWDIATKPAHLRSMFLFDMQRGEASATYNLGINNIEGRIPWAQIYYLNGLMDILLLSQHDEHMYAVFGPLLPDIKKRLDLEVALIDRLLQTSYYFKTRAFTVHREEALFSVQTSRLLLLFNRYSNEVPNPVRLANYDRVKHDVMTLNHHIEVLSTTGESAQWLKPGRYHLRWPKGSAFYFDGVAVPYNHQNEWAYAVLTTMTPADKKHYPVTYQAARDIVDHFRDKFVEDDHLPATEKWDYWWGTAYDGWRARDDVSVNRPAYNGDRSKAWISFKTIDAMAMLAASRLLRFPHDDALAHSAVELVNAGTLYPFASYEILERGYVPMLDNMIVQQYIRYTSPWEHQSAAWAYLSALPH